MRNCYVPQQIIVLCVIISQEFEVYNEITCIEKRTARSFYVFIRIFIIYVNTYLGCNIAQQWRNWLCLNADCWLMHARIRNASSAVLSLASDLTFLIVIKWQF